MGTVRWSALDIDISSILDIEKQSYRNPWDIDTYKIILSNSSVLCAVHEQDSDPKILPGLISGFVVYRVHSASVYIVSLGVLKDCRRLGVGTKLINHVKLIANHDHMPMINTLVSEYATESQLFLKSCGFNYTKRADTQMRCYKNGSSYYMTHDTDSECS